MTEDLPIMILLNMVLDTQQMDSLGDELFFQVILDRDNSIFLLQEALTVTTISTKIPKPPKT